MRRFDFRLERILSLRRHTEDQAEQKLARVSGEYAQLQGELGRLTQEREATFRLGDPASRADINYRIAQSAYINYLETRSRDVESQRAEKAGELDAAQSEYREAMKQRKVLDNLKSRRSDEYYREQRRAEGRELDDIGGQMSIRRHEQEGGDA
ncbi:MAG: flagellar export protein FliJ [Spirochaetes bacterium]|jgi:flagellar FliJ protein|nr:flagellar export protein FliJ [Spirochaetota bacterium]